MRNAGPESHAASKDYGTYGADYRFSSVDEVANRDLRHMFTCWNQLRGARAMPTRDEVSPRALGSAIRHVQMFEIVDGGRAFRCRVYGSGLAEITGMQVTGCLTSEVENSRVRERMDAALHRIMQTRAPVRMSVERSALGHLEHKQVETVWLPLGNDGEITHVLSGCVFANRAAAA